MLQQLSQALLCISMLGLTMQVQAAWQTTPYIARYGTALHSQKTHLPYAYPHAPKGGVWVVGEDGAFDNLNSMNGKGYANAGNHFLFDSLMSKSGDEVGVFYPLLAEKISYDPTQTQTVIFHLNPQARFSDGSPLTAYDVKMSFDLYKTQSNFGLQMYLADLVKTEVLSSHQVKMSFKQRHQPEMLAIVVQMPIYAKKEWQKRDFKALTLTPILGSGPYVVKQVQAGRQLIYQRDENYWGRDLLVNRGRYNVDQIHYRYFRSPEIKFEAFKAGRLTFFEEKNAHLWHKNYQFPALRQGKVQRKKIPHQHPIATQSLILNTRKAPFNDLHFRQALTYAYDFEWMNKAMFAGQYQRLNSFFSNSELASSARPSTEELNILKPYLSQLHPTQRQLVQQTWQYPKSDGSGFNRQNLLQARKILLRSGYYYRDGQLYGKDHQPIRIEFLLHQADQQKTILPYMRNLQRLGIQSSIRMVDISQFYQRLRPYHFDIILDTMPQSLSPAKEQLQLWGSAAAQQVGNYNYAGIQNPVVDALIQQLLKSRSRQQLILQTRALDRVLRAGFYHIPTYGIAEYRYAYWNIYGKPKNTPKLAAGLDYWWVDQQQQKRLSADLNLQ